MMVGRYSRLRFPRPLRRRRKKKRETIMAPTNATEATTMPAIAEPFKGEWLADAGLVDAGLVDDGLIDDDVEPLGVVYCEKDKRRTQ